DTRLRKLRAAEYDAVVLAAAGLMRMGWSDQVTEYLPPEVSLPAIGQGALGLEGRRDDAFLRDLVMRFDHPPTRTAVAAERGLLERLQGGCQVPIAAHAITKGDTLILDGMVASVDGTRLIRDRIQGPVSDARELGVQLAERLLSRGADAILTEIYGEA
ncbi:MAG: hydroxymethylbilane synthase, partial [Nitrospiraceae bacterium]